MKKLNDVVDKDFVKKIKYNKLNLKVNKLKYNIVSASINHLLTYINQSDKEKKLAKQIKDVDEKVPDASNLVMKLNSTINSQKLKIKLLVLLG